MPHYQVLRTKTKKRIFRKLTEQVVNFKDNRISQKSLNQSIQSYLGVLKHANTYKLEDKLRNNIFFWLGS